MNTELKPCPCCGHVTAPRISASMGFEEIPPEWDAWVVRCDASPGIGGCGMQSGGYDSEAEAAEAWNRRAESSPHVGAEPVAWRCKDCDDRWIIFQNKKAAELYQEATDCLMQPLYTAPQQTATPDMQLCEKCKHLHRMDITCEEVWASIPKRYYGNAVDTNAERKCVPKLELPRTFTREDLAKEQRLQEIELDEWLEASKTAAPSPPAAVSSVSDKPITEIK